MQKPEIIGYLRQNMKVVADQSKIVELAERQIVNRFKEGRGSGSGQDYVPFLTVRDVPLPVGFIGYE